MSADTIRARLAFNSIGGLPPLVASTSRVGFEGVDRFTLEAKPGCSAFMAWSFAWPLGARLVNDPSLMVLPRVRLRLRHQHTYARDWFVDVWPGGYFQLPSNGQMSIDALFLPDTYNQNSDVNAVLIFPEIQIRYFQGQRFQSGAQWQLHDRLPADEIIIQPYARQLYFRADVAEKAAGVTVIQLGRGIQVEQAVSVPAQSNGFQYQSAASTFVPSTASWYRAVIAPGDDLVNAWQFGDALNVLR